MNRILGLCLAVVMLASVATFGANYKEGDKGVFVGAITQKGPDWFVAKNESSTERFTPRTVGGAGGGYEKNMVDRIAELKVGDRVEVSWEFSEHLRAVTISVLKAPTEGKTE